MRILISNDDGIESTGLAALAAVARLVTEDVWIIAPDSNQSGVGHGISLRQPITLTRVGDRRFSCSGTPADCVIAALTWKFVDAPRPDLVLAGINEGLNVAEDVAYSGTMAIAREAAFWGIPVISISRPKGLGPYDRGQSQWLAGLLSSFWNRRDQWSGDGHWLNLNLPKEIPAEVRHARIGRDKIAHRSRVISTDEARTRIQIIGDRAGTFTDGDENHFIVSGYASVTNLAWHGFRALPDRFCEEWPDPSAGIRPKQCD